MGGHHLLHPPPPPPRRRGYYIKCPKRVVILLTNLGALTMIERLERLWAGPALKEPAAAAATGDNTPAAAAALLPTVPTATAATENKIITM